MPLWWYVAALPMLALQRRHPLWAALLAAAAGAAWVTLRGGLLLEAGLPPGLEGVDLWAEGVVVSIPERQARGVRFELRAESLHAVDGRVAAPSLRLRLSDYGDAPDYRAGERWRLRLRLKRPRGFANPGGFDYEAWLFQRRVRATGYVRSDPGNRRLGAALDPQARLAAAREALGRRVQRILGTDERRGILLALLTGDRAGITPVQWEVLRRTGTGHLVAISGLHVGLVAAFVYLLAGRLWRGAGTAALRLPAPRAAALAGLAAAAGYAALAGFSLPTQRALVMLAVGVAALAAARRLRASQVLALALLAVLILDPLAPMSSGFWLSFAAVGLIVFGLAGRQRPAPPGARWLPLQGRIALGLAPLLLWQFGEVPLSSPLANLLAIPVVGLVVVPLVLVGGLLSVFVPTIAGWLLSAAGWVLALLWPLLDAAARVPPLVLPAPAPWALALAAAGVLWLLSPAGTPARWTGALCLLPALLLRPPALAPGEVEYTQLDVGQGLAAVVRTRSHLLVYDAGPAYPGGFDAGRLVLVPFLRQSGAEKVDLLVVSHGDSDHIGGVRALRAAFPPAVILTSVPARVDGARACAAGQGWEWDGVRFSILHPSRGDASRDNNASCVLRVVGAHGSLLLAGDIEAEAESALLRRYDAGLATDVLLAPHHGSRSSSTPPFIAAVRPRVVIFAAGYRSRYGHPHDEVVARYRDAHAALYASPRHGALRVLLSDPMQVSAYRERVKRYWRAR